MKIRKKSIDYLTALLMIIYMIFKVIIDNYTYSIFKIIFAIIIITIFFLFFHHKKYIQSDYVLLLFFSIYSFWIILLCMINNETIYTRRALYEYIMYMMILFSGAYFSENIELDQTYSKIKVVGLLLIFTSISEILNNMGGVTFRILGTSRSVMAQGMLLGIYAQINFFFFVKERKWRYFVIILITIIISISTGSRGAIVATLGGLLFQYTYYLYMKGNIKNIFRIILLVLILSGFLYIFFTMKFHFSNSDIQYWIERLQRTIDWKRDAGNAGRLAQWGKWFSVFRNNMIWGIGPSKTGSWGSATLGVTESGVLRHLVELGLIGFILYYAPIIFCIFYGLKNRKHWRENTSLILLHYGFVIAILIEDFVLQITEEITVAFFQWWALGVIYGITQKAKDYKTQ